MRDSDPVRVGVRVSVNVRVDDFVSVQDRVADFVSVAEGDGDRVGVSVPVTVTLRVSETVAVTLPVSVGVVVRIDDTEGDGVSEGVRVAVGVRELASRLWCPFRECSHRGQTSAVMVPIPTIPAGSAHTNEVECEGKWVAVQDIQPTPCKTHT